MSGGVSVGESVSFAEHESLKVKHAALVREHETSLETIKILEKKLRELVVVKEDVEFCEYKSSELQKKLETIEKEIKDMMYSEVAGVEDLGTALGEDHKVVIVLSDDDEGNGSESSGGDSDSEDEENLSFYL